MLRSLTAPIVSIALACTTLVAVACGVDSVTGEPRTEPGMPVSLGLPSCGASTQPFTVSPVSLSDLIGWVPLGNLGPPGHLFPTDHQYLYINHPEKPATIREVTLLSPGNITIIRVHRTTYSNTTAFDYAIEFSACDEIRGEFGHVTTIEPDLLAQLGAFDQQCSSYSLGNGSTVVFSNCYTKIVKVPVAAGARIGTVGGQGTSFALDFSLFDSRVPPIVFANPARWLANSNKVDRYHIVPASEYFAEPLRSEIRKRVGSFDGSRIRRAPPEGGTIAVDVPGTMQGVWMNPAQPTFPEGPHLAIVPDNVDPTRMSISMGTSQPWVFAGLYWFDPVSTGTVNRHPAQITADGTTYCFDAPGMRAALLARLEDATTLRVEGVPNATCATLPSRTFSTSAFVYKR